MSNQPSVPYSQEAEEATIGAVLLGGVSLFKELRTSLTPDDFFLLRNNYVWDAFGRMVDSDDSAAIDYLTTIDALRAMNRLDGVGGEAYILGLFRSTPDTTHARAYVHIVKSAALRRRLMAASDEIRGLALNENMAIDEVMAQSEARLEKVSEQAATDHTTASLTDASERLYSLIEERMTAPNGLLGVPTGYHDLDYLLDGFTPGLHVLAGRPGMGKTALELCFALAAAKAGIPVFFASMEMEELEILIRLYSMETGIDSRELRRGKLNSRQWQDFVDSLGRIGGLPLFIDDSKALSPRKIRTKVLQTQRKHKVDIGIIFADGIYKMTPGVVFKEDGKKITDRRVETGYICSALKNMTGKRELGIPIVATHQLSRAVEQRQDKRPMMSDLRESGDVEQEADNVMFIYRDEYYNDATEFPNLAEIIIAKQRAGATGTVELYFDKSRTKFVSAVRRTIDLTEIERPLNGKA